MNITERQSDILDSVVRQYIRTARPVSSEWLHEEGRFDLSPATLRIELSRLSEEGYLFQPHVSAGRVPTDKGYRFLVDSLEEAEKEMDRLNGLLEARRRAVWDTLSALTRLVSARAATFVLGGFPRRRVFFKEGWDEVLAEPEFEDGRLGVRFARLVEAFEEEADRTETEELRVLIGSENPFSESEEFSLIVSGCSLEGERSVLAVMGPKRMSYDRNIELIREVRRFLEEA